MCSQWLGSVVAIYSLRAHRVCTAVADPIFRSDIVCLQALEPAELSTAISDLEAKLGAADRAYATGQDNMNEGSVSSLTLAA